jgi:hypothetical protein
MKRFLVTICLVLAGGSGVGWAAHPALAANLCVGGPGCYATIPAALTAAQNGDTIHLGPGTFTGGISITKSVKLIGAGAALTTISGGGPVVTIGTPGAISEPTVSLIGVTVTGGSNHSFPSSSDTRGGGIYIAGSFGGGSLTTVTINNSVITGNTTGPVTSIVCNADGTIPCGVCVPDPTLTCSFAGAAGIDTAGTLTINDSTVSNNSSVTNSSVVADGSASQSGGIGNGGNLAIHNCTIANNSVSIVTATTANLLAAAGGIGSSSAFTLDGSTVSGNQVTSISTIVAPDSGITAAAGGLGFFGAATIRDSVITGNQVTASGYEGFASSDGGGIVDNGSMLLVGSTVSNNQAHVTSTNPNGSSVSVGGGVHLNGPATIRDTKVTGNSVENSSAANTGLNQFIGAFGGGIDDDNSLVLMDSTVDNNSVTSTVTSSQPSSMSVADGGGMEVDGSAMVKGTNFSANHVTGTGTNFAYGGAVANFGTLSLQDSTVNNNAVSATGLVGAVQGGGVWNSNAFGGPGQLTLIGTTITHNSLTASGGITTVQGGGLYTNNPVTQSNTVIAQNTPDQCFGC